MPSRLGVVRKAPLRVERWGRPGGPRLLDHPRYALHSQPTCSQHHGTDRDGTALRRQSTMPPSTVHKSLSVPVAMAGTVAGCYDRLGIPANAHPESHQVDLFNAR